MIHVSLIRESREGHPRPHCLARTVQIVSVFRSACIAPQLRNVVRSTPPNKIIEVYVGDSPLQWTTWSKQPGVSLMGDAAHSMLPTLGTSQRYDLCFDAAVVGNA